MSQQLNGKEVKEKILSFLNLHGPSLPVHIAKYMQMSSLFASAFLSELSSEGAVKISSMKVGGSPLYYTPNKIGMLGNFSKFLNEKEKEAFNLLKEKKILSDEKQQPAIRVALRNLKDFALPFKKENRIFWRFFSASERELEKTEEFEEKRKEEPKEILKPEPTPVQEEIEKAKEIRKVSDEELSRIRLELEEKKKELEKIKQQILIKEKPARKAAKTRTKIRKNEEFLNEIKEILKSKNTQLLEIIQKDSKIVFARIILNNKEHLLAAFNKKKIENSDILKAYKKSIILNLPYYILSKGEPSKKTLEAINAFKNLADIELIKAESKQHENSNL